MRYIGFGAMSRERLLTVSAAGGRMTARKRERMGRLAPRFKVDDPYTRTMASIGGKTRRSRDE